MSKRRGGRGPRLASIPVGGGKSVHVHAGTEDASCLVHELKGNELVASIFIGMRQEGGINVCPACVTRAKEAIREKDETPFIMKVQRPLDGEGEILVYNQCRAIQGMEPADGDLRVLMGDSLKVYAYARLLDGVLVIDGLAPEQEW